MRGCKVNTGWVLLRVPARASVENPCVRARAFSSIRDAAVASLCLRGSGEAKQRVVWGFVRKNAWRSNSRVRYL